MPGHADPTPRVQGSPASLCGDGLRQDQAPETTEDLVVDKVKDMDRFRGKRPRVRYAARTERGAFRERFRGREVVDRGLLHSRRATLVALVLDDGFSVDVAL